MAALNAYHVTGPNTDITINDSITVVNELVHDTFIDHVLSSEELSFDDVDVVLVSVAADPTNDLRGLGVEGALTHLDVPVISITDTPDSSPYPVSHSSNIEYFTTTRFDAFITPSELADTVTVHQLRSLADDYQHIADHAPLSRNDIIQLLNPPSDERVTDHIDILPTGSITRDATTYDTRYVADWIRGRFLDTPGPVNSTARTATRLGTTIDSFTDHIDEFESARYDGVFSDTTDPRWWIGSIISTYRDIEDTISLEHATCVKCGRTGVDRAAHYTDGQSTVPQPVHYGCSNIVRSRQQPYIRERTVDVTEPRVETMHDKLYGNT